MSQNPPHHVENASKSFLSRFMRTTFHPGYVVGVGILVMLISACLCGLIVIACTAWNSSWVKSRGTGTQTSTPSARSLQMLQQSLVYSNVTALEQSLIVATVVYQPHTGRVDASAWCGVHAVVIGLHGSFVVEDASALIAPQDPTQNNIELSFDFSRGEVTMNIKGLVQDMVLQERSPQTIMDMVFLSDSLDEVENVNTIDLMTNAGRSNLLAVPQLSRGNGSTLIGSYTFSSLQAETETSSITLEKEAVVALLDLDSRKWWIRAGVDLPLVHASHAWNISVTSPDTMGDWCRASFFVCQGQNPVLFSTGACADTMRVGCQILFNPLAGTATLNMSLGGTLMYEITLLPISEALLIPILIASRSQTT